MDKIKKMENFDYKEYRKNLNDALRKESEGIKKREILQDRKKTDAYQEAKKLKKKEFEEKKEEELVQYASERLQEYEDENEELQEILEKVGEGWYKFENEFLPSLPQEYVEDVFDYVEKGRNANIEAELQALGIEEAELEFQNESDMNKRDKAVAVLKKIYKTRSYYEKLEKGERNEIEIKGFDRDEDTAGAEEFLEEVFGDDLLKRCLISKIEYFPEKVNVNINGTDYILPVEKYKQCREDVPQIKKRKFRADSFVNWNTDPDFSAEFLETPIYLYSFFGENPQNLEYLQGLADQERMRAYKLGTLAHEVGHHLFSYLLNNQQKKEWRELIDNYRGVTEYADSLSTQNNKRYDEHFAEAVRLKATVPDYLSGNFKEVDEFIDKNFPQFKKET